MCIALNVIKLVVAKLHSNGFISETLGINDNQEYKWKRISKWRILFLQKLSKTKFLEIFFSILSTQSILKVTWLTVLTLAKPGKQTEERKRIENVYHCHNSVGIRWQAKSSTTNSPKVEHWSIVVFSTVDCKGYPSSIFSREANPSMSCSMETFPPKNVYLCFFLFGNFFIVTM